MVPLLIVGGILLALAALLLAPVRLELSFREAFSAQVRYLFFRIPLAPGKEEEPPPPQETLPPEEAPPKGPGLGKKLHAMLRREGLRGFLQTLQELAQAVGKASKSLLKKLRLNRFDLHICLGGEEDAAQGAILYGQVCGAAYSACGALFGLLPCRRKAVSVDLDYHSREYRVDFSAAVSIRVLFLLVEGLILLYKALPFFKKLQQSQDHIERISRTRKQGETK